MAGQIPRLILLIVIANLRCTVGGALEKLSDPEQRYKYVVVCAFTFGHVGNK